MRYMGLDVGDRTIGISISDELGWTAQGLDVIRRKEGQLQEDLDRLKVLIDQYNVQKIIVGLPKNMNGSIGTRGELCKEFGAILEKETHVPVQMWDERLSTVAAERMLIEANMTRNKRKKVVDKVAAVMILQGFLDSIK